ncbi:DUF481 domain-containing protein [Corallococcus sp. BB11-1]|uniref:DUF481 domain-containing protein n=1 Tax=Corallococcus sp. BB11-1 TaxID=2996783 RepID=UPI0022704DD3|nr:DUF481 domain-containing protein [Corallococcus sp. BB11-1]MCY1036399.1 DUF481 domain-containing protein [Corallococcus sp. BB11-1]
MACSLPLLLAVLAQTPEPNPRPAPAPTASPSVAEDAPKALCEDLTEKEAGPWTGSAALSFLLLAGNSRSLALTANGLAEYRTKVWVATFKADGVLETAASAEEGDGDEDVVAEALVASVRGERRFTPLLGAYALVYGKTDHLASIELRLDGEAGIAFTLLERDTKYAEQQLLRLDLGLHYSNESRFQYFEDEQELPSVDLLAPGGRLTFYYPFNERLKFTQYLEVFPNILGDSRLLADSTTKLSTYITHRLALSTNLLVQLDTAPAAGKAVADVALTLGAEFEF